MFKLSKRLSAILSLVDECDHFWDLCCDHGQLGISVAQNFKAKTIHFVDIVPGIIEKLKKNLKDTYIPDGVKTKLYSQDAATLIINEKSLISIAGIGGLKAIEIIQNIGFDQNYIVAAHGHTADLRAFLKENEMKLSQELLIKDGKHIYEIMKISRYGEHEITLVGSLFWNDSQEISQEYLEKNIFHLKRHLTYENDSLSELLLNKYESVKNKFNKL